jgi:hypothetical protein
VRFNLQSVQNICEIKQCELSVIRGLLQYPNAMCSSAAKAHSLNCRAGAALMGTRILMSSKKGFGTCDGIFRGI